MSDSSLISPMNQVPLDILTASGARMESRLHVAKTAATASQKNELKKAAQEFEAIFIAHMLKVMRETIQESGLMEGGFGKSIYTELFDQEVSLNLAQRGALGIAELLEKKLMSTAGLDGEEDANTLQPADALKKPAIHASDSAEESLSGKDPEDAISDIQLPVQVPISSHFGMRLDPFTRQPRFHKGIDLAAPAGMPVVPALPGTVVSAGYEGGYGNTVLVEHAGGLRTRYAHLGSIHAKVGDAITPDNVLGTVGSTGRSTGPHLHFEVIRDGKQVDPERNLALNRVVSGANPEWNR